MKKILCFALCITLVSLCLFSCKKKEEGEVGDNNTPPESESAEFSIVYDVAGVDGDLITRIYDKLYDVTGELPTLKKHTSEISGREIVVGKNSREISEKAYNLLDRMERPAADYVRYLVYTDGTSVAIAFDEGILGLNSAEEDAVAYFLALCDENKTLTLEKGTLVSEMYSVIERQRVEDKAEKEEAWASAEAALTELYGTAAEEMISALKQLYTIYSEDAVTWLADLYDPVTGGFYYSNSARDTEGYLPDLESTYQALAFLEGSGMLRDYGGKVKEALPEWMQEQIVAFTKGLQDKDNGYFYHPQWSKVLTDSLPARRGRDLTNATNILSKFGKLPTYNTPSGVKGDGLLADGTPVALSRLTERFSSSAVSAVSKVLLASDPDANVTPHLRTKEAFVAYLNGLDVNERSYYVGNLLESQANQILARDAVLKARGEDYSLSDILAEWFDKHQNKVTGTWRADDEINYDGVNGILKISSTYTRIKKAVPNPDLCIKAAMIALVDETPAAHVCDILNPWYAITVIRNNLTEQTGSDELYLEMMDEMAEQFAASTLITREKLTTLLRNDGSFGYLPESSASSGQGAPVAVPNTWEGDVNACYLATVGVMGHLFNALGINDARVQIFGTADFLRFLFIVENLGEVIKDEPFDDRENAKGEYAHKYGGLYYVENTSTYDLGSVYRYTTEVRHDMDITKETHEYMRIVADNKRDSGVLEYGKASLESYYGLCFGRTGDKVIGNCLVFETEIKINNLTDAALSSVSSGSVPALIDIQLAKTTSLTAASVSTNIFYDKVAAIYLTDTRGGGYTALGNRMVSWQYKASGCFTEGYGADKWYTVRVEVYDNGMAKYFVDNEYVGEAMALSDPSVFSEVDTVRFAFNSGAVGSSVWLDNTFVGNVDKEYVPGDKQVSFGDYEFRPGEHYENFGGLDYNTALVKTLEYSGYIVRSTYYTKDNMEDKSREEMTLEYVRIAGVTVSGAIERVLEFTTLRQNAKGIYIRETVSGTEGDVFVLETDIKLAVDAQSAVSMLNSGQHTVASIYVSNVAAASSVTATDGGTSYFELARIYLTKDSSGRLRYCINYPDADYKSAAILPASITSGFHTFTAEIYRSDGAVKYYVDGVYIGEYRGASDTIGESFDDFSAVKLTFNDKVDDSSIFLDNTFVGRVNKAYTSETVGDYEETPDTPTSPTPGAGLGTEDGDLYDPNGWN